MRSADGLRITWVEPPSTAKRFVGEKVTCICPTGDRQDFINESISCFLAQDYPNKELLIVDDGVTPTIVPENSLIKYLRVPKMDLGSKRNFACENATGSIIAHWDDDDWYAPHRLSVQIAYLRGPSIAANPRPEDRVTHSVITTRKLFYYDMLTGAAHHLNICGDACGCGTSMVYLKSYWQSNKFILAFRSEDVSFGLRALSQGVLLTIDVDGLVVVQRHDRNTCDGPGVWLDSIPLTGLPSEFLRRRNEHPTPEAC